jgi:prepilin signal peptidase PulO-like enzyme (type II secretory pathway)
LFGEVILGLWFVGSYLYFGVGFENLIYGFAEINLFQNISFVLSLILGSIFFMLVMEDLSDMEVSAKTLYVFCAIGILGALVPLLKGPAVGLGDVVNVIWALVIFSPFWFIYFLGKYLNKPMIGEADPYVFTALGLFFGTQFSISLFLYSVWVGSILGIGYLYFVNKKLERNVRIPFLPIIFLACLIILLFNYHVIKIQDILVPNEIMFKS